MKTKEIWGKYWGKLIIYSVRYSILENLKFTLVLEETTKQRGGD